MKTDKEKLKTARTAIESLSRNLEGLHYLAKMGNRVTVITSLAHMAKRCKEIEKEIA